jgi:uncharacterized membrane protein
MSGEMVESQVQPYTDSLVNRAAAGVLRRWLLVINVLMGVYVLTPFAAPVLMKAGLEAQGQAIYAVYSTQCHQLPERSFFLFGPSVTYPIDRINDVRGSTNLLTLRQFIGNDQMGYKVAWSDRMVSLYTSVWLGSLLYALLRTRAKPLPLLLAAMLLVPIFVDGGTHFISDLQGFGQGFRDTNGWLRALTQSTLPPSFYAGDGWGSFNSLTRLWTGVVAGLALAWAVFPRIAPLIKS